MIGSTTRRLGLRIAITARESRTAIAFVAAWLVANGLLFAGLFRLTAGGAVLVALCVHKADDAWGRGHAAFPPLVLFATVSPRIPAHAPPHSPPAPPP